MFSRFSRGYVVDFKLVICQSRRKIRCQYRLIWPQYTLFSHLKRRIFLVSGDRSGVRQSIAFASANAVFETLELAADEGSRGLGNRGSCLGGLFGARVLD